MARNKATNKRMKKNIISSGYLYLIKQSENIYKIGVSTNPNDRLKQLSTSSPYQLEIVNLIYTNDMYTLEKLFHKLFLRKNTSLGFKNKPTWKYNREWFKLNSDDVRFIKNFKKEIVFNHTNKTLKDYYTRLQSLYFKSGCNRYI